MKRKLPLIFILFMILSFVIPTKTLVNAEETNSQAYEYTIDSCNISILVNEDNILHVTEKFDVFFNVSKHGIYRTIPLVNKIRRADGSNDTIYADISDISCSDTISKQNSGNNCTIKIGDTNTTITGAKTYTLSYDYELSNNSSSEYDELYYNLIGTGWNDTTISNLSFNIIMPKDFDSKKLGFSYGLDGTICSDDIDYSTDGKTISGTLNHVLQPNEAFTVRLELPEGYFNEKFDMRLIPLYVTIGIGVLAIISLVLWFLYGKDNKVFPSIEFYPPKDLNSAEAALLYKGVASNKDINSLLIYLANKGYIEITETESKFASSFKLTRLKFDSTGNEFEDDFINGLFKNGNEVTKRDLKNSFYRTINKIRNKLNNKEFKLNFFTNSSLTTKKIINILFFVSFIAINLSTFYCAFRFLAVAIFLTLFALILTIIILSSIKDGKKGFASLIVFVIIMIFIPIMPALVNGGLDVVLNMVKSKSVILYVISMIFLIFIININSHMEKRTEDADKQYQYLLGFKEFLETAEKPRLEALVNENPNYFYDILPFTYVLGISKTWISKFESIATEQSNPNWYHGTMMFSPSHFYSSLDKTLNSVNSSSSSSGGHSGGGMSGGGSGGGGGGSW